MLQSSVSISFAAVMVLSFPFRGIKKVLKVIQFVIVWQIHRQMMVYCCSWTGDRSVLGCFQDHPLFIPISFLFSVRFHHNLAQNTVQTCVSLSSTNPQITLKRADTSISSATQISHNSTLQSVLLFLLFEYFTMFSPRQLQSFSRPPS